MIAQTDRELLELAAKAAKADYEVDGQSGEIEILSEIGGYSGVWNPLTDDGDAMRLAVKLNMLLDAGEVGEPISRIIATGIYESEPHAGDPCAATRRAIVRAAAEIGRQS